MPATIWVCIVPGPEGDKRIRAWTADNERAEAFRKEGLEMQEFSAVDRARADTGIPPHLTRDAEGRLYDQNGRQIAHD